MAEVDLEIGGRSFRVGCEDGQEARLRAVAGLLDGYARQLGPAAGELSESRLMLMTALMCGDALSDEQARNRTLDAALTEKNPEAARQIASADAAAEAESAAAALLDKASERLERMAAQLREETGARS